MENLPSHKSKMESKSVQIPVDEYEKDLCTELGKEKKEEILNLFTHFNNLRSRTEFEEIETKLHHACKKGDVELIKIYLSETVENDSKDLKFKIGKTNQTALLFKINKYYSRLIIPRTFKHESTEYLITSISGTSELNESFTLKFAKDSAVKTIYRNAFSNSGIRNIIFPSSLRKLKKGWCTDTDNLRKILVSPSNCHFKFIDNKYLIGKSDQNTDVT